MLDLDLFDLTAPAPPFLLARHRIPPARDPDISVCVRLPCLPGLKAVRLEGRLDPRALRLEHDAAGVLHRITLDLDSCSETPD